MEALPVDIVGLVMDFLPLGTVCSMIGSGGESDLSGLGSHTQTYLERRPENQPTHPLQRKYWCQLLDETELPLIPSIPFKLLTPMFIYDQLLALAYEHSNMEVIQLVSEHQVWSAPERWLNGVIYWLDRKGLEIINKSSACNDFDMEVFKHIVRFSVDPDIIAMKNEESGHRIVALEYDKQTVVGSMVHSLIRANTPQSAHMLRWLMSNHAGVLSVDDLVELVLDAIRNYSPNVCGIGAQILGSYPPYLQRGDSKPLIIARAIPLPVTPTEVQSLISFSLHHVSFFLLSLLLCVIDHLFLVMSLFSAISKGAAYSHKFWAFSYRLMRSLKTLPRRVIRVRWCTPRRA